MSRLALIGLVLAVWLAVGVVVASVIAAAIAAVAESPIAAEREDRDEHREAS